MIHDVKKQHDKLHKTFYWQFDWTYKEITIFHFKWYPTGKGDNGWSLFYPQKYLTYHKKWKDVVRLTNEVRQVLLDECSEMWGKPVVKEPVVKVRLLIKMAYYPDAFGPNWVAYEKHKELIDKNFDHWIANGMLIEER